MAVWFVLPRTHIVPSLPFSSFCSPAMATSTMPTEPLPLPPSSSSRKSQCVCARLARSAKYSRLLYSSPLSLLSLAVCPHIHIEGLGGRAAAAAAAAREHVRRPRRQRCSRTRRNIREESEARCCVCCCPARVESMCCYSVCLFVWTL